MAQLIISFFAALAVAVAVYFETSSLGFAFLAYSASGTLVLITAFLAPLMTPDEDKIAQAHHV